LHFEEKKDARKKDKERAGKGERMKKRGEWVEWGMYHV